MTPATEMRRRIADGVPAPWSPSSMGRLTLVVLLSSTLIVAAALGPVVAGTTTLPRARSTPAVTFCARRPIRGQITLIPGVRGAPLRVRFVLRGLPPRTIFGLFVDQGRAREAYNITFGVRSDRAGALVRTVQAFRPPEKPPLRVLLESYNGRDIVNAVAYPCDHGGPGS